MGELIVGLMVRCMEKWSGGVKWDATKGPPGPFGGVAGWAIASGCECVALANENGSHAPLVRIRESKPNANDSRFQVGIIRVHLTPGGRVLYLSNTPIRSAA